ncbi:MAG: lytic transglycosylase domain-containing protein [Chloroflexi bacterium]|nr:lytic transglycosylase domain-containing protein [Chloroflexota bacterium]
MQTAMLQIMMQLLKELKELSRSTKAAATATGEWVTSGDRNISAANPSSFDKLIEDASGKYNLDPALVKAVIHAESNFNPRATSKAGAQGLMQLMPGTASGLGVQDSYNPAENVDGGTRLLKRLLNKYDQNVSLALAAYNAGSGAVDKYGGIPPYEETQRYVPRILSLYKTYRNGK